MAPELEGLKELPDMRDRTRAELHRYYERFVVAIPERIVILEGLVRQKFGYEMWSADYSRESIDVLGRWFADEVDVRPRTESEMAALHQQLAWPVDVPTDVLTDRCSSLAADVGIYFAQSLMRKHAGLRWKQIVSGRRNVDYGYVVVDGFGKASLNPIRIAITSAYGIAEGNRDGRRLVELFDYWSDCASKNTTELPRH